MGHDQLVVGMKYIEGDEIFDKVDRDFLKNISYKLRPGGKECQREDYSSLDVGEILIFEQ